MRIQVCIRDNLARVLTQWAVEEHRGPKQQAEWLLHKTLEQVAQEHQPQMHDLVGVLKENHV